MTDHEADRGAELAEAKDRGDAGWTEVTALRAELKRAEALHKEALGWMRFHRDHEKRLRDAIFEYGLRFPPGSLERAFASDTLYDDTPEPTDPSPASEVEG